MQYSQGILMQSPKDILMQGPKDILMQGPKDLLVHAPRVNSGNHSRVYSRKAATLFTSWILIDTTDSGTTQYHTEFIQGVSTNLRKAIQSIAQVLLKTPAVLSKIKEYTLCGFSSARIVYHHNSKWILVRLGQLCDGKMLPFTLHTCVLLNILPCKMLQLRSLGKLMNVVSYKACKRTRHELFLFAYSHTMLDHQQACHQSMDIGTPGHIV